MAEQVTVNGIAHGGEGVARLADGIAVFIEGALPGELVDVEIIKRRKNFARGRLLDIVEPAPERTSPPCKFVAEGCGGCDLQHTSGEGQRELKTRIVREQLQRLGRVESPNVHDCITVGPDVGYRNRARLHAGADGRLGFHRAGTHDVVAVDPCLVLAPAAADVLQQLGSATGAEAVEVRGHDRTGSRAVVIEPGEGGLQPPEIDAHVLLRQPSGDTMAMRGDGELTEEVGGLTYRFDASCFFQANTSGADALVEAVVAAGGDLTGALTWDLYAGVGLLSLPLVRAGAEVIAVEGHARSAEWAARNGDDHEVPLDVRDQPVSEFVATVAAGDQPDVVVLDPPRVGAGLETCAALAAAGPETIVYVACDVGSLARDVRELASHGYQLIEARPLDLFPMTHHVEVVATLRR